MNSKRKALLLVLCAVVLAVATTAGTFAYLTDTEAVKNTFTVGQVGLKLDEAKVNPDGTYVTDVENRVQENTYHLLPGHTYIKDPTIYIDANSSDCYLFVKVENGIEAIETTDAGKTIAGQMAACGWVEVPDTENIYVLAKGDGNTKFQYTVSKDAEVKVFEDFTIDGDKVVNVPEGGTLPGGKVDLGQYENAAVKITAYAVQADGFDTSLDAWAATFGAPAQG